MEMRIITQQWKLLRTIDLKFGKNAPLLINNFFLNFEFLSE
jgi:hypothetical protein